MPAYVPRRDMSCRRRTTSCSKHIHNTTVINTVYQQPQSHSAQLKRGRDERRRRRADLAGPSLRPRRASVRTGQFRAVISRVPRRRAVGARASADAAARRTRWCAGGAHLPGGRTVAATEGDRDRAGHTAPANTCTRRQANAPTAKRPPPWRPPMLSRHSVKPTAAPLPIAFDARNRRRGNHHACDSADQHSEASAKARVGDPRRSRKACAGRAFQTRACAVTTAPARAPAPPAARSPPLQCGALPPRPENRLRARSAPAAGGAGATT